MAIIVPLLTEYSPKGVDKMMSDFDRADGAAAKMKVGLQKAFLPAAAALAGLGAAAWDAAKAGEELASAQARLANVFSQMGVGDATERVTAYADELERTLGIDEKVILQAQATLGTFGEIAASADDAGGAFDRATMAALDLAAAGFGTAESNAVQLGKALNDPIKGLASLSKSGVTFTDQEKAKIKTLVESNQMMEAQALVLDAIEKQVGGTAEATADSSAKMALAWDDVRESIGVALLPVFNQLNGVLASVAAFAQDNTGAIIALGTAIAAVAGAIVAANIAIKAYEGLMAAVKIATAAWTAAQWLLNVALNANPIGLVVIAITALIGIVVLAYNKVDWFRDLVDTAWDAIQTAIEVVVEWFQTTAWPILKTVFDWIARAVKANWDLWVIAFDAIKAVVEVVWNWLSDTFGPGIELAFETIGTALETMKGVFSTVFDTVKTIVSTAWEFIQPILDKIRAAVDFAKGAAGVIGGVFGQSATVPTVTRGRTGSTVNVTVQAGIGDPVAIARQVENVFRARNLRLGYST